jgi:8-amino-7-oxononanoate synthase
MSLELGKVITGAESARLTLNSRLLINFVGCSYLALQDVAAIKTAATEAVSLGQAWSQMVSQGYGGVDVAFNALRRSATRYFGVDDVAIMPSGYFCGPALLAGYGEPFDCIVIDELAHFSLHDAATLAKKPVYKFQHADADSLYDVLRRNLIPGGRAVVLTDGVFPVTGEIAPLAQYRKVLDSFDGDLLVDDSHGYGVLGSQGRGTLEECATSGFSAGTLSKAFCTQGAIIPCDTEFALRAKSRSPLRGSSAGAPATAYVASAALDFMFRHPERRLHVQNLAVHLKNGLVSAGLNVAINKSPIAGFQVGGQADMAALQARLFDSGYHVLHSMYIGAGPTGMIRCAVFADHSREDIDSFIQALKRLL